MHFSADRRHRAAFLLLVACSRGFSAKHLRGPRPLPIRPLSLSRAERGRASRQLHAAPPAGATAAPCARPAAARGHFRAALLVDFRFCGSGFWCRLRQLTPVLLWEFQGFTSLFRADFYLWVEEKAPISLCAAVPFPEGTVLSRRMRSAPWPGAGGRSEGVCFRAPRPARGSGFCVRPRTRHLPCCSSVTHPKPGSAAVSNWRLGRFFMMTKQVNFAFRSNFFIANSHFP